MSSTYKTNLETRSSGFNSTTPGFTALKAQRTKKNANTYFRIYSNGNWSNTDHLKYSIVPVVDSTNILIFKFYLLFIYTNTRFYSCAFVKGPKIVMDIKPM